MTPNLAADPPVPAIGYRRIGRATLIILVIALGTCIYTIAANGQAAAAAKEDRRIVDLMRAVDNAGRAALAEEGGAFDAAATNSAFADLTTAANAISLKKLRLPSSADATALTALLSDPSGALSKARASGGAGLREFGISLLPMPDLLARAVSNTNLSRHATAYAANGQGGAQNASGQTSLTELSAAADSLYSSSRARVMVGVCGALVMVAGILFLATRPAVVGPEFAGRLGGVLHIPGSRPASTSPAPRRQPAADYHAKPQETATAASVAVMPPPAERAAAAPPVVRVSAGRSNGGSPRRTAGWPPSPAVSTAGPAAVPAAPRPRVQPVRPAQPVQPVQPVQPAQPVRLSAGPPPSARPTSPPPVSPVPRSSVRRLAPIRDDTARPPRPGQLRPPPSSRQPSDAFPGILPAPPAVIVPPSDAPRRYPDVPSRRPGEATRPAGASSPPAKSPPPSVRPLSLSFKPPPAPASAPAAPAAPSRLNRDAPIPRLASSRPGPGGLPVAEVLKDALTGAPNAAQVRWAIQTTAVVPAPVARRLARIVSGLIEAAAPQDPDQPVLVAAGSTQARLMVVVSESSGSKDRGRLALGAKPAALLSLLRQLNGSLVASPAVNGIGTDTILSVPLNRAELPND